LCKLLGRVKIGRTRIHLYPRRVTNQRCGFCRIILGTLLKFGIRMRSNPGDMSRDPLSANHPSTRLIQQPIALHPVTHHHQQPAVILTSYASPTQLPFPVGNRQLPATVSAVQVPPSINGSSNTAPQNYHSYFGCQYVRNCNPEDWADG